MRRPLWFAVVIGGCTPGQTTPIEPPAIVAAGAADARARDLGEAAEPPGLLEPLAFREGRIELAAWAGRAHAIIDGEPIPLRPGRAVIREAGLAPGLLPDKAFYGSTHELIAFGGDLDPTAPTAHVVFAEHFERSGSSYFVYARTPEGWTRVELPRRGREIELAVHYGALVESAGALFGLRRYTIRSEVWDYGDDDDPEIQKQLRALERELARAPRGFVALAGAPAVTPALAKGWDASKAVATTGGEIVALGYRFRTSFEAEDGPARLLSWAAGEAEAGIVELPGLGDPSIHDLGLWAAGDAVLVGGVRDVPEADDRPYLAIREPGEVAWTEVALELPPTIDERVASATRTPAGELWIVIGGWNYASEEPCPCLWRKPAEGAWEHVELAPVSLFRDAEPRWVHVLGEQSWIEVPAGIPPTLYPAARDVIAADGAIWVTADLGPSYPTSSDFILADPRTLLYSSVALEPPATPRELISSDRLFDERVDRRVLAADFTPGSDDCRTFHMVIAEDPDGAGREALDELVARREQLADVATIEEDDGWASASVIYVGELDGRAQLVVEASAWNPRSADALADAFAGILGRRPALDCRPRKLLRAIEVLR